MTAEVRELVGLSLGVARGRIASEGGELGRVTFVESKARRLTVLEASPRQGSGGVVLVDLRVAGANPINYLPGIYQQNDFLQNFLWIVQHLQYEIVGTLDDLHLNFVPKAASPDFLNWLAGWFDAARHVDMGSERLRSFLQKAMLIYRWRGTRFGLLKAVELVVGVKAEIYENEFPLSEYAIYNENEVDATILDRKIPEERFFTLHVPLDGASVTAETKRTIFDLVKVERPVNTVSYITYERAAVRASRGVRIAEDTTIDDEGLRQ